MSGNCGQIRLRCANISSNPCYHADVDLVSIIPHRPQSNLDTIARHQLRKTLAPLDQHNRLAIENLVNLG